jgi:basic membrane protein A and related proteins
MKKQWFRFLLILVVLSMGLAACQPATPPPAAPAAAPAEENKPAADSSAKTWKMAAIFPGVITDADYNTLAYMGLEAVKKDLNVETAYSESVAVPDVERVMREYIDQGSNIVWTHGSQFVNQTIELSKQFPKVVFIAEGDALPKDLPANVWFIDRNFHTGFYGIGALAARITKTGKIGYVGGLTLPFSYAEVHAMQQAITDSGLKVELKPVWAGDFNDPAKSRQVADTMIAEGIDVIVGSLNLGMQGVFESVKAHKDSKILVTAKYTDKSSFAPDNYVTSLLYDFVGPMKEIVGRTMKGETGGYYPPRFSTGVKLQEPLKNVDAKVGTDLDAVINDVKSEKIKVNKDISEIK